MAPLAVRMRPRSLDEVVGQDHVLAAGSPMRRLVEGAGTGTRAASLIVWGPPGTGKTTLAHLVAQAGGRRYVELSAVTAGVKDVRAVIDDARRELGTSGRGTVLFVDEVHRFSKTQQDALLPAVENGWVTLVAATTENPSFSIVAPLLSRSLLVTLRALDEGDVRTLLERAVKDDRGLAPAGLTVTDDAMEQLTRLSAGDARWGLTALEAAAGGAQGAGRTEIDAGDVERAVDRAAVRYDRDGDQHYDVTSALIKSVRGSDVDAALHYLARMMEAGEDPRFIARRLIILASEDIGLADPTALLTAVAAYQAVQLIGLPEGRLTLAQAVIALSLAPKSNAVTTAIGAATADVREGRVGPVPSGLRDAHYAGAKKLGHGTGYQYAHDHPHGVATQQYPPDVVVGRDYYAPTEHGAEREVGERLARLRRIVRGIPADPPVGS
ncbi:MAG TPA: replication-associated recombination protein A [Actinomycetes bacterium]